ncbi:MAG: ABC transporter permease [Erysipelotrichaceae bacterium]|nr:ABC transporter permease [Erysipelotrichaceae bacterium]
MRKRVNIIAGFLAVMILVSLTACSSGKENPTPKPESAETVLSDLTEYSYTWRIAEFLNDSSYDKYMHDDGQLFQSLMSFSEKLRSSEELTFTPYTVNPVELLNVMVPDQCIVNYGTEFAEESVYEIGGETVSAVEALQVTDSLFDLFPLQIAEGRGFTDDDYGYLAKRRIPVILGAAYKETFSIGDTFEGYYIFERFTFEVIGFAESGSVFYSSADGRLVSYDRYIIMPFAYVSEDSEIGRIILLQQISGFITDENGKDHALKQVNEWLAESGLNDWIDQINITDSSLETVIQYYLN